MDPVLGGDPQAPSRLATPERNRYYYGKLLDVSHFELEQNYLNGKRWLLNRLIAGTGVVCGLAVTPAVNGTRLIIDPGVAIDGWGREIVAASPSLAFDPRALTDDDGNVVGTLDGAGSVTVSICYRECGIDPAPVMIASCKPDGNCATSITREQYCIVVKEGTAVPNPLTCTFPGLFVLPENSTDLPDILPALSKRLAEGCSEPTGQGCILLAQVNLPAEGGIETSMIDATVRPIVVGNAMLLELIFCLAQRLAQLSSGPVPTPTPTPTPSPTPTPTPTPTPAPTAAPEPTAAPTPTPTLGPTRTPLPTITPTRTPLPTILPTRTPLPTLRPTLRPPGVRSTKKPGGK